MALTKARPVNPADIHLEDDALVVNATNEQLKSVSVLADRLLVLQEQERKAEEALAKIKEQRRAIEEVSLPEAMDACGMASFKLKNGGELLVESVVAGSIPKATLDEGIAWLKNNGHAGLIKHEVKIALARGQEKLHEAVMKKLAAIKGITVESKDVVHPQTLGAWAREMVAEGRSFPKDTLGIFMGRRIKVKEPKK